MKTLFTILFTFSVYSCFSQTDSLKDQKEKLCFMLDKYNYEDQQRAISFMIIERLLKKEPTLEPNSRRISDLYFIEYKKRIAEYEEEFIKVQHADHMTRWILEKELAERK